MSPGPIGYLSSVYPRATDTFVRGEIEALRALGERVETFSVRRPEAGELLSERVREEARRTTYLLQSGALPLLWAALRALLLRPARSLASLALSLRSGAPGASAKLRSLAHWLEALRLAQELERRGIGHLHNHITGSSAQVALLASHQANVPWSTTVHGMELSGSDSLTLGTKLEHAAFGICISEYTRSQCMLHTSPATWPRLHVIRCGLSSELLERKSAPLPAARRFVCVGRLAPEKGQRLLLEAFERLVSDGLEAELVLVGDGPLRDELESRTRSLGLAGSVRITGWADRETVTEQIESARALVVPSFSEGLPVVAMEALALGRPVIASRVGGVPELVESGATGWLVDPGSIPALASALHDAATCDVAHLEALAARGAERVRERHDALREARKLARLFPGTGRDAPAAGA